MGRAHGFCRECIREAAQGTIKLANAWYWPIGIPVVALGGYHWREYLPLELLGANSADPAAPTVLAAFAALTVAVSWLLFFVIRLVGAPARLHTAGQAQIRALAAEVDELQAARESDIALGFADDSFEPVRQAGRSDAPVWQRYSVAVNNVGDGILRDCQVKLQVYGDAWSAPNRRRTPIPIPVSGPFPLRPGESRSVALLLALDNLPSPAVVIERYQEVDGGWRQSPTSPELVPASYTLKVVAACADARPAQLHLRLIHQGGRWTLRRAFQPPR